METIPTVPENSKKEVLRKLFLKGSSTEVRKALVAYLGSAIDLGQFPDIQEYTLEDGGTVTVDYGLRNAKFSPDGNQSSIIVQVECGSDSWQTSWEEWKSLTIGNKEEILNKILS